MLTMIRRSLAAGKGLRSAIVLAGACALGACDDDDPIDPGPTIEWGADLTGEGDYQDVSGAAAVVATSNVFAAEIAIEGAADGDVFTWGIHEGTCATPGDLVGDEDAYPDLEADTNGEATAEADDTVGMSADEDYIVRIRDESGNTPVVVACSALAEVDD